MTTEVEAWGDKQQYHAETHGDVDPDVGVLPTVHLQWMTPDPLGAMAMATGMYEGKVFRDISEVTDEDRKRSLEAMQKTHLTAGLEVIRFQFLFDGVDRAFTHQDVRQRTAVFFQESLRFAVLDDLTVATTLPPSLAGTRQYKDDVVPSFAFSLRELMQSDAYEYEGKEQRQRWLWDYALRTISTVYERLINTGMPAEEARGILPTAVATRIVHNTDLRNMIHHAGNRLCTQAQFHWRLVFNGIVQAIRTYTPDFSWVDGFTARGSYGQRDLEDTWEEAYRWQYEAIADSAFFRPACYQLGHCPFQATFDRACSIRERVEIRAKNGGNDSSQWHKPFLYYDHDPVTGKPITVTSDGINPAEWLLDPAAARI